jgi:hypothetical protein
MRCLVKKPEPNKKYGLEKKLLEELELNVKGSWGTYKDACRDDLYGEYDFGWGDYKDKYASIKKSIDNIYDYDYSPNPTDVYNIEQQEADRVRREWRGALVRFNTRYYNSENYGPGSYSTLTVTSGPHASRLYDDESCEYLKHTGTVVDVSRKSNYKGQWCVTIMWSDALLSYENILDVQIIQPGI